MDSVLSDDPRRYVFCSLGLGLEWGWTYLFCTLLSGMDPTTGEVPSALAILWKMVAASVLAIYALRPASGRSPCSKGQCALSSILGVAATALWFAPGMPGSHIVATAAFGASYAMFLRYWVGASRFGSFPLRLFSVGLSCIVAGVVYFVLAPCMAGWAICVPACLPLAAWVAQRHLGDASSVPAPVSENPRKIRVIGYWPAVGAVCLVSLALGIDCQVAASGPRPDVWTYSSTIAGCLMCAASCYNGRNVSRAVLAGGLLMLTILAAAALPFMPDDFVATLLVRVVSFVTMSGVFAACAHIGAMAAGGSFRLATLGLLTYLVPLAIGEVVWLFWSNETVYLLNIALVMLALACIFLLFVGGLGTAGQGVSGPCGSNAGEKGRDPRCRSSSDPVETAGLTAREREVLSLLAKGYSIVDIAQMLNLSYNTVKAQSRSIYQKLGVHKRKELIDIVNEG